MKNTKTNTIGGNSLLNAMTKTPHVTRTENGAKTFDQSGSKVLDMFSLGGAYRTRTDSDVISLFDNALSEDANLALRALFYLRDVREGQGERRFVRVALQWLAKNRTDLFISNMENIPFFGRWDDLFVAFDTPAEADMIDYVKTTLANDARQSDSGKLTLLAKWMPSNNTSSKATRKLAGRFAKAFKITPEKYRKTLSDLRSRLNVIEKTMSANEWGQIDFEHVPSKANLLYRKAFSRHEPDRYTSFIKAVQSGDAKMNSGALYPYEIIRDIVNTRLMDKNALDAMWQSLPNYVDGEKNILVLPDVSGSMSSTYGGSVQPLWVSVSLAIYAAQRNKGAFKDYFLEFSSTAKLVKVRSKNIVDAWNEVRNSTNWCGSTDLQSAFDAILDAAKANKVPQADMPETIVIISDMEFNSACTSNNRTNFEETKRKYAAAGYPLPKIVFWNVSARSDQSPVKFDDRGVALVSGCSPTIFKQVLNTSTCTPYTLMVETLSNERYDRVQS